jgi:predicted metalloendopeptidase
MDDEDMSKYILTVNQAGLTMGDKFRYLDDFKNAELFEHFKRLHNLTNLNLAQTDIDAAKAIQNVIDFEITLAGFTKSDVELSDPKPHYNPRSVQNCTMEANLDFLTYFSNMGFSSLKNDTQVNVVNPDFIKKMGKLLSTTPLPLLKDFVNLHTIVSMSYLLPQNIRNELGGGIEKQMPRWRSYLDIVEDNLRDDIEGNCTNCAFFPCL